MDNQPKSGMTLVNDVDENVVEMTDRPKQAGTSKDEADMRMLGKKQVLRVCIIASTNQP